MAGDPERVDPALGGEHEAAGAASRDAVDVESAKRSLQALVEAGIHAQDLLGQDDDDDDDDDGEGDEDEGSDDEGGTPDVHAVGAESAADKGTERFAGGDAPEDQGHHDLLSHVASSLRALISHGLTTAVGGAGSGLDDGGPVSDDDAYNLACSTLENNLRYQRLLRKQLGALEAAQRRNKELQESIGTLLSIQGRASGRRGGRRGKDDRTTQVDPVTGEARI
ncbi:hypothetical protein H4R19_004648, partial [Coemansia spiralis]